MHMRTVSSPSPNSFLEGPRYHDCELDGQTLDGLLVCWHFLCQDKET